MRLFLHRGPAHLQILSRSHLREFRDVGTARDFLRPLLADPANVTAVRRALGVIPAGGDLLEQLASRVVGEGLQVVSCGESFFSSLQATVQVSAAPATTPQTTPLQDEQAAKATQETAPQAEEQHWIEIELIDDAGKPVVGELYFVELPDGSSISGRTDGNGRARVDGVDPGTAKVSFPDLDKSLYTPGGGSGA
jgi:hypothetical protein